MNDQNAGQSGAGCPRAAKTISVILTLGMLLSCAPSEQEISAPATVTTASASAIEGRANPKGGPRGRPVYRRAAKRGRGSLKVVYGRLTSPHRKEIEKIFQEERLFEDVVDSLNETLVLPSNVEIRLVECEEANAFYVPDEKAILLCYEGFEHMLELFSTGQTEAENEEAASKAVGALVFTFYHELGHALIDVYDLPITGREEDAVDQLATVMLLETWEGEESEHSILASAEAFELDAGDSDQSDMADEHSLDQQRYYNLVCWIYGSDPEYFEEVAKEWELPPARAERCSSEYARMSAAWSTLLGPHMRPAVEPATAP